MSQQGEFVFASRRLTSCLSKESRMLTNDFPKHGNANIPTDYQEPNFSGANNKFERKRDKTGARKTTVNDDEKFENIVNETIESTRNLNITNGNRADPPPEDGSSSEQDEEESDGEEKEDNEDTTDKEKKRRRKKKIATIVGVAALGAAAAPFAVVGVLGAVGFGSAGVVAGSVAAAAQSAIYGGAVASGSIFATCQSIGAAGLGVTGITASAVFAGIGAGISGLFSKGKNNNDNNNNASNIGESSDVTSMVIKAKVGKAESHSKNPKSHKMKLKSL